MTDPQKAPLPEHAPVPNRHWELVTTILAFGGKIIWIFIKLWVAVVIGIVALILATTWR